MQSEVIRVTRLYLWRRCGNQHAIRGHQSNEVVPMAAV
jgi:hypothetical protein